MTYQWKVGDKAVRVSNNPPCKTRQPIIGEVYTVSEVSMCDFKGGVHLALTCYDAPANVDGTHKWAAFRFRPVIHDKPEKCDEEFLTLLKKGKKNVKA